MQLLEKTVTISAPRGNRGLIEHIEKALSFRFTEGEIPLRLAIASVDDGKYICEIGCLVGSDASNAEDRESIFALRRRDGEAAGQFNAVYVVPTGIGAPVKAALRRDLPAATRTLMSVV